MSLGYEEFVDFIAAGPTSKDLVDFQPSEETRRLVEDLIRREKTSGLSAEETEELNQFLHIEHLFRLAKARARKRLSSE
jgi:hypothetical protein